MVDLVSSFYNYREAEQNNDLVDICASLMKFLSLLEIYLDRKDIPEYFDPKDFYKLNPHIPRRELRESTFNAINYVINYYDEDNYTIKLKNIYTTILASMLIYHLPVNSIIKLIRSGIIYTRNDIIEMLLKDNMSPNWIKEPEQ